MHIAKTFICGIVPLCAIAAVNHLQAQQTFYTVAPTATYLRTNSDNPTTPTVIALGDIGGQQITLTPSGLYAVAAGGPVQSGHFWVMFSSSNVLLADNGVLNRVQDAIDVGSPLNETAITAPSFYGDVVMDIPFDFFIPDSGLNITVPVDAQYLFVGIPDSYLADNSSPQPDKLGLTITTTPEPSSLALLCTGLGLVPLFRRKRMT